MSDTARTRTIDDIFYRDITREINQVVTVDNDDPEVIEQELREYVLTPQLEKHFSKALEVVLETEHGRSEDVGMWISGFFGSGKSHFMKILGYLLEGREFGTTDTTAVFKDRIEGDKILAGNVEKVTSTFNSEVSMFQIGAKSDATGSESITETVLREFNTEQGYASTPWVAAMERDLEERGIYDAFRRKIRERRGEPWEEVRSNATFVRTDMASALTAVSDAFETREDARAAIDDVESDIVVNPAKLTELILEHVERREAETDKQCRYFVFIDEISQFVGDDGERLLELQGIVEEFKQQGGGKLFLGVTSQEELQQLIPGVLEQNAEESKLIDRFPHRFQLISDNLDRVVRERILKKDGGGETAVGQLFDEHEGVLTARYKLNASRGLKEITRENFVDCYPFLPYQLDILPDIFAALRGEGSDDRLTGRERTLIDVTQSVLKDEDRLYGSELGHLVTLDTIFDEISEDVPDTDVRSIQNAEIDEEEVDNEAVDDELARRVLKSLYLLQQLDWLANSAANVATTLQRRIGRTHELEKQVDDALEALVEAGYVGRDEEGYRFLRETERQLENEIMEVRIRSGDVRRGSKKFLKDVLDGVSTINYSGQVFDVNVTVDDETIDSGGHVDLVAHSPVQQSYETVDERQITAKSHERDGTIYWIADTQDQDDILSRIKKIKKTETVLKQKRGKDLSAEERDAVGQKQEDLQRLREDVRERLRQSFQTGEIIYHGSTTGLSDTNTSLSSLVKNVGVEAVERVFPELEHGQATVKRGQVEQIFGDLSGTVPTAFRQLGIVDDGELVSEARVATDVLDEIVRREENGEDRSGADLIEHFERPPYGWNRDVVRLAGAVLFRNGSIIPTHKEQTYESHTEPGAQELFGQISKFKQTTFDERETVDPQTRTAAKKLVDKLFDRKVRSTDQAIDEAIRAAAEERIDRTGTLLPQLNRVDFPLTESVSEYRKLLRNVVEQPTPAKRIRQFVALDDDLTELDPTVETVDEFCNSDTSDNLSQYETIKQFVGEEWPDLLQTAESNPELVSVDDDAVDAAQRVQSMLDEETVVRSWPDIKTDYRTAASEYLRVYESLLARRHQVYTTAVESVRTEVDDEIDASELDTVVAPLEQRRGPADADLSVDENDHVDPELSPERLVEHIQTVDTYRRQAFEAADELIEGGGDEIVRERVDVGKIFGDYVVESETDLEAPVAELREEVSSLLDREEDVEIRFH